MFGHLFLDHPRSVNETYLAHFRAALSFAVLMFGCGLAVTIHALVPCLFEKTASRAVARLYDRMVINRVASKERGHRKLSTIRDGKAPCDETRREIA